MIDLPCSDGLIVRVVECNPDHHACPNATHPEWTNAGALTAVHATLSDDKVNAQFISESNVFWAGVSPPPRANHSLWGAADPRIAYRKADSTYYLTWDNCTQNCYPTRSTLLSTTKNPFDHTSWTCHGPLLKNKYTGGASLLLRDEPPHYAFVGDSNTANIIMLATSQDGINWEESSKTFMEPRPDCWDAKGVAAGPQPELLSNGDYFYIYNIDTGFPYHPNPLGRCAIGWAILNGSDPTQIVARAEEVLLVPTFPWETCPEGKGRVCQEPMVVFSTGMKPLGDDTFLVLYGAADTDVGVAKVKVTIQ